MPPTLNPWGGNGQISISGDGSTQLKVYWDKLADGSSVEVPLERQPWGDEHGHLLDQYGFLWMVNIAVEGNRG